MVATAALLAVALLSSPQVAHAFLASPAQVPKARRHQHVLARRNGPSSSKQQAPSAIHSATSTSSSFLDDLSGRFQGDFDNYEQVLADRTGHDPPLTPREGGGHEHIHCTLVPINANNDDDDNDVSSPVSALSLIRPHVRDDVRAVRLAAFYFDGLPERIFRFRLYALWDASSTADDSDDNDDKVGMTLYSLSPEVEGRLRGLSGRPLEWVPALLQYLQELADDGSHCQPFLELHGCDVEWRPNPDPERHAYAYGHRQLRPDDAHHAVMVHGEATIPSLMNPGSRIRVVDELSLWEDDFWINDRGFDPDTGDFVYGNQRGVPYQMRRVSSLVPVPLDEQDDGDAEEEESSWLLRRRIDNESLAWTLGDDYRSTEQYNAAMEAIGGASARMNAKEK